MDEVFDEHCRKLLVYLKLNILGLLAAMFPKPEIFTDSHVFSGRPTPLLCYEAMEPS